MQHTGLLNASDFALWVCSILQSADSCSGTLLQAFAKEVERLEPEGIDILLNNAGQGENTSRAIET